MGQEVYAFLERLYERGNRNKSHKVSADKALMLLNDDLITTNWTQKLLCNIPKIKAFFSLSKSNMRKTFDELNDDDMEQITEVMAVEIAEEEVEGEAWALE